MHFVVSLAFSGSISFHLVCKVTSKSTPKAAMYYRDVRYHCCCYLTIFSLLHSNFPEDRDIPNKECLHLHPQYHHDLLWKTSTFGSKFPKDRLSLTYHY